MGSQFYLLLLILAIVAIPLAILLKDKRKTKREEELRKKPFPKEWENVISKNFPMYNKIPRKLRDELNGDIQIFIDEKFFEGCNGFEITEEVKLLIAAQACTLLINRTNFVYPKVSGVLVYPTVFYYKQAVLSESMRTEGETAVAGISYDSGEVGLAWDQVLSGAMNGRDGHNVVFHEFAHQLDRESGETNGCPRLEVDDAAEWVETVDKEFKDFIREIHHHHKDVIDDYGATNPAEFFAVTTETFFEKPYQLQKQHPQLFQRFLEFYKDDPRTWQ